MPLKFLLTKIHKIMKIVLKQLTLVNFRGIASQVIDFDEHETSICGDNATGKTSIFDAFLWLLFGKDHQDRKDFNVKTWGADGRVIERLPHEVSGILLCDGIQISLKRCYCEKWQRRRGAEQESFTGHETKYYVNGVEKSMTDYNGCVAKLCSEETFKFLTNPLYFTEQKKEVQRAMLFTLAGDVSDADIAGQHADFVRLFRDISGKTLEDYKKELAARKRTIKAAIEDIPARIEEVERSLPSENYDYAAVQKELSAKKQALAGIDAQIADTSQALEAEQKRRSGMQVVIGAMKQELFELERGMQMAATETYRRELQAYNAAIADVRKHNAQREGKIADLKRILENSKSNIQKYMNEKNSCSVKLAELRSKWQDENGRELVFDDNEFACPACKRALAASDVELRKKELHANFNSNKAEKLEAIQAEAARIKACMETAGKSLEQVNTTIKDTEDELAMLAQEQPQAEPNMPASPAAIDFSADPVYARVKASLAKKESEYSELPPLSANNGNSELYEGKKVLQDAIESMTILLGRQQEHARAKERISELKAALSANSTELAGIEKRSLS
jgi:DNA repair exonuclease SbcCD ATPase subunit